MRQAIPLRAVLRVHDDEIIADDIGDIGIIIAECVVEIGFVVA